MIVAFLMLLITNIFTAVQYISSLTTRKDLKRTLRKTQEDLVEVQRDRLAMRREMAKSQQKEIERVHENNNNNIKNAESTSDNINFIVDSAKKNAS